MDYATNQGNKTLLCVFPLPFKRTFSYFLTNHFSLLFPPTTRIFIIIIIILFHFDPILLFLATHKVGTFNNSLPGFFLFPSFNLLPIFFPKLSVDLVSGSRNFFWVNRSLELGSEKWEDFFPKWSSWNLDQSLIRFAPMRIIVGQLVWDPFCESYLQFSLFVNFTSCAES